MTDSRDARWTFIGQSTWVLQIAPNRYLLRSTQRGGLDGGVALKLMVIESEHNIATFAMDQSQPLPVDTPLPNITRVEVIDHSPDVLGRAWSKRDLTEVTLSVQDEGRTLKVFVR